MYLGLVGDRHWALSSRIWPEDGGETLGCGGQNIVGVYLRRNKRLTFE